MEIIQQYGFVFMVLAVIFSVYLCWGIGANDVANAMGTSVGSGTITIKQAILIAAVFEFLGALLASGDVTSTIRDGIIVTDAIGTAPEFMIYGMLASLFASASWLMVATARGWPVSTTHTVVGAIVGFAMVGIGPDAVRWGKLYGIIASWVTSPILGGIFAYLLMLSIRHLILNTENPYLSAKRWGPSYVFLVGFITCLVTLMKGLPHLSLNFGDGQAFLLAVLFGLLTAVLGKKMIDRVQVDAAADRRFHFASVEKVFGPMMIFTACAMAFAQGANDVASGIGPLAAVAEMVETRGRIVLDAPLPLWIFLLGGTGIVVGLATYGYRVIQTIGSKITELTPTRGYCATLSAALTVVVSAKLGLPVSTTHIAVGAVMGVGLARGIGALDLRVLGGVVVSWVITLPVSGLLSAFLFFTFKGIFS